jgi:hypothetical protein
MKRTIREWMPLIALVALVAVPLILFGLKFHWIWSPITGYPIPFPLPVPS